MSQEKPIAHPEFSTADTLAFERTRLAHERTMMAWTRTSLTLITFGFGIYKFFEIVPHETSLPAPSHVITPRTFAFLLAFLGNISLLLAAIQHRVSLQAFRALGLKVPFSGAAIMAAFMSALGIVVLIAVLLRL